MGIHLAHNIRIRLARLKNYFFASSVKFTFVSMSFCGKWVWSPPDNAMPSDFPPSKSGASYLSVEVSFVSVLATALLEYGKKLEEIFFWNDIILKKLWKWYNFDFSIFWKIGLLKEPLGVQKQTILQQKVLILSFLEPESLRAWHYQEGSTPTCRKKTLKKKVATILFLHYELSVCPLLLNYNKVYFASSLIAKPTDSEALKFS